MNKSTFFSFCLITLFALSETANSNVGDTNPAPPTLTDKEYPLIVSIPESELRELKVQTRELADQLLDTYPGTSLHGKIVYVTTFVNLNNPALTSSIGKYIPESLVYELNNRSMPVKDYALNNKVQVSSKGTFIRANELDKYSLDKNALILVGTYLPDPAGLIVNARLLTRDNAVVRTAQVILPMNGTIARLSGYVQKPHTDGTVRIGGGR